MRNLKTTRKAILICGLLGALFLVSSIQVTAAEAEREDLFDVLQLAETISGPGQFAFPLFAPIDLGSGYEDRVAPFAVFSKPAPNEVDVPVDISILISLADYGSGVDGSTVSMYLNDEEVHPEISSGEDSTLDVLYQHSEPFKFADEIKVAISAGDFAQNTMNPNVFSFKTVADTTLRSTIGISTNKTVFMDGQLMVLLVSLKNPTEESMNVNAYIAVEVGDALLFYPDFTPSMVPIELQLPAGFEMDPTVVWTMPLFGIPGGSYTWYAALENVETGEFGQVSSSHFEFVTTD
ncbi:MAG: hypothetical protein JW941_03050 [Candidatus Coatesbacteria bacterium]|nr:hypothetical protein [Candidatus Coatesbacteria bacterium]